MLTITSWWLLLIGQLVNRNNHSGAPDIMRRITLENLHRINTRMTKKRQVLWHLICNRFNLGHCKKPIPSRYVWRQYVTFEGMKWTDLDNLSSQIRLKLVTMFSLTGIPETGCFARNLMHLWIFPLIILSKMEEHDFVYLLCTAMHGRLKWYVCPSRLPSHHNTFH